jgi:hypothetical protein
VNYAAMAARALAKLSDPDVGFALTFTRKVISSVSAGKPTFGTDLTASGYAVKLPPVYGKNIGGFQKKVAEATLAGREALYLLVSGMSFAPSGQDTTTIGGLTYKVIGSDVIAPNGTVDIIYGVGVER